MRRLHTASLLLALVAVGVCGQDGQGSEDDGARYEGEDVPEATESDMPQMSEERFAALFKTMDSDGDGKISASDLHAFGAEMNKKRAEEYAGSVLEDIDADKDGKVTLEEILNDFGGSEDPQQQEANTLKFRAADKDGDGSLNAEETALFIYQDVDPAVEEAHALGEIKRRDQDGDAALNIKEFYSIEGDALLEPEEESEFASLDTNGDKKLDAKELQAYESGRHHLEKALAELVRDADDDKDGLVTLPEVLGQLKHWHDHEASFYIDEWAQQLEL